MKIFWRHFFRFATATLILAGCAQATHVESEGRPAGARLSTPEVIRMAQQAAERDGRHLGDYKPPETHYEYMRKDKSWWVFFDGRVPMPGNHFSVTIEDQTGKTRLMPGE